MIVVIHISITFLALMLAKEHHLIETPLQFLYFYTVTSSTVGYGDLSPSTYTGKLIVALWVIPGGIAIFTAILGKTITMIQEKISIQKNGMGDYSNLKDHVVIVGYDPNETKQLILETKQKLGNVDKVIVATLEKCDHTTWVRAQNLIDADAYERAGVKTASRIVISLDNDAITTNAIMAVTALITTKNPPVIICYVQDPNQADLIEKNFPNVRVVTSNRINYLARSMADPGIAEVFDALANSQTMATMFAHEYNDSNPNKIDNFEQKYECSVVAVRRNQKLEFLNNYSQIKLNTGDTIYYIANQRILQ